MNLLRFIVFVLLALILCNGYAQETMISGIVKNETGVGIDKVKILVNGSRNISFTDHKGEFEIMSNIGDTLFFIKEYYCDTTIQIKRLQKVKIKLVFNKVKFTDDVNNKLVNITGGCQPLFVVNGEVFDNNYSNDSSKEIDPIDIVSMDILKGSNATDVFGYYASNGAVLISTMDSDKYRKYKIKFDMLSDVLYAPYGLGFYGSINNVFKDSDPLKINLNYLTGFNSNNSFEASLSQNDLFNSINGEFILSYKQRLYETIDLDFKELSLQTDIRYLEHNVFPIKIGVIMFNDRANYGFEIGYGRKIRRIKSELGLKLGYWFDFASFEFDVKTPLIKDKFYVNLNYNRIENIDFYRIGLLYDFKFWRLRNDKHNR